MDCRKSLVVVLGLLSGSLGCNLTAPFQSSSDAHHSDNEPSLEGAVAFANLRESNAEDSSRTQADQQEERERARKAYQFALTKNATYVPALVGLARLYDHSGDHEHALATYQKATQAAPKDPVVWYELGMSHNRKKEWEPAIPCFRTALNLDPDNQQCITTLGHTLARAGRYDESYEFFRGHVGEARAHFNLARMLQHCNQEDQCRQHLMLALQADPQLAEAKELLAQLDRSTDGLQRAGYNGK